MLAVVAPIVLSQASVAPAEARPDRTRGTFRSLGEARRGSMQISVLAAWFGAIPVIPAVAQVVSVQPAHEITSGNYAASARMQFGAVQPQNYLTAVLGGAQITSDQQAVVVGQGGFFTSANPPYWAQGADNTFRLSYSSVTQRLTLTILQPGGGIQAVINDVVNFAGANGLNLNLAGLDASYFGGLTLTSAGQTVAIGPGGDWSGTSLANSTLTGWNLTQNWRLDGYLRFLQPGQSDLPRLQFDVMSQGLAYQLSSHGAGRPEVLNYGITQAMIVTDAGFQQAQFGGTDGVVTTNIQSKGAVTFDIAGTAELSGGVFDLTSALVAPADQGTAELVKTGAGTLILSGPSNYSGKLRLQSGSTILRNGSGIGAGGVEIGSADLALESQPSWEAGMLVDVLASATICSTGVVSTVDFGPTIVGSTGTSLTLQGLETRFRATTHGFFGDLLIAGGSFDGDAVALPGGLTSSGGARCTINGSVQGNVVLADATLALAPESGDRSRPGLLRVDGSLLLGADSKFIASLHLGECGPGRRCCDAVTVGGGTVLGGEVLLRLDPRESNIPVCSPTGTTMRWPVIQAASVSGSPRRVTLRWTWPDGTATDFPLAVGGSTSVLGSTLSVVIDGDGLSVDVSCPSPNHCLGDVSIDGVVDGADLGAVLFYWGPVTSNPTSQACDIDHDGVVRGSDLGLLLSNWGPCPN